MKIRPPTTNAGVTCFAALMAIVCFATLLGIAYLVDQLLGCSFNPASISQCDRDIVSDVALLIIGFVGVFGLFLLSPFLLIIAIVAGAVCAYRKAW